MSWFRVKPVPETGTDADAKANGAENPTERQGRGKKKKNRTQIPSDPYGLDAGFCWGDDQKR